MPWEIPIQMFSYRVCMYTSTRRLNVFVHLECFRTTFFKYCLCVSIRVCVFMYARVCMGVWNMFVLVCVCLCLCTCVCVFMCACTRVCLYDCACMWVCMGVFACLHVRNCTTYVCVCACVHMCACVFVHVCTCVCGGGLHVCVHVLIIMSQEIVKYCMFNCRVCTYT